MSTSLAATEPQSSEVEHGECTGEAPRAEQCSALAISDLFVALVLGFGAFAINAAGTWPMEFFRHTEADRMMIAMEMVKSGDYLVPRLLDSVILTKPPMFYWLIAASVTLLSDTSEWVGRMPSVFAGAIFAGFQYLLLVLSGLGRVRAAFCSVVLCTSLLFMQLGAAAEIDMVFGLFCGLGLSSFYLALRKASVLWTIVSYLLFALAFLTKGPPVVFFAAGAFFSFLAVAKFSKIDFSFTKLFGLQIVGVACFLAVIVSWVLMLGGQVGWDALAAQYNVEVHQRVFMESNRHRSALFYFGSFFIGMAPWTAIALAGGLWLLTSRSRVRQVPSAEKQVVWFHGALFLFGFILLSIAHGKSSRYLFPVYGSAAVAVAYLIVLIKDTPVQKFWFAFCRYAFFPIVIGGIGSALYFEIAGVTRSGWLLTAFAILTPIGGLWFAARKNNPVAAIAFLCTVMLSLRVGQAALFAPHRNFVRSVKPLAAELQADLPSGEPLYVLEMFERWIFYYMTRDGRSVFRLDPDKISKLPEDGEVLILLHKGEEYWRVNELFTYSSEVEIVKEYSSPKEEFVLVKAPAKIASQLRIRELFPTTRTVPSPYNNDPAES